MEGLPNRKETFLSFYKKLKNSNCLHSRPIAFISKGEPQKGRCKGYKEEYFHF